MYIDIERERTQYIEAPLLSQKFSLGNFPQQKSFINSLQKDRSQKLLDLSLRIVGSSTGGVCILGSGYQCFYKKFRRIVPYFKGIIFKIIDHTMFNLVI